MTGFAMGELKKIIKFLSNVGIRRWVVFRFEFARTSIFFQTGRRKPLPDVLMSLTNRRASTIYIMMGSINTTFVMYLQYKQTQFNR